MARDPDHYSAEEAAQLLGTSPARVRQMLRSGELEGERGPEVADGVPGPWRVPAGAVHAFLAHQEAPDAEDAEATVVLPPGGAPARHPEDTPSRASERLSDALGRLKTMAQPLLEEIGRLEGRLEVAEIEQIALREALRQEKERSARLEAELEAERSRRPGEGRESSWRRMFGG